MRLPSSTLNKADFINISQAADFLSSDVRKKLGLDIPIDVYVQDPLVAEQARNADDPRVAKRDSWEPIQTIYVPREPSLMNGPTSSRIAVVDYDADTNRLEDPVEWDDRFGHFFFRYKGEKVWLTAEHRDKPQFHQVNVWAIVQSIIGMYESAWVLDRSAPWAFDGGRIILVPHAGEAHNAIYVRGSKSIQFYYFNSGSKRVYTCLSHDIIAHETGHAILDGLRPLYQESMSLQTSAFHEFIADLTAIMTALLNNDLRWKAAEESAGDLSKDTIISSLAEEFGYYSYGRPYLRSAKNERTMACLQTEKDCHEWSQVLTGAMFDILKEIVAIRMTKPLSKEKSLIIKDADIKDAYDFGAGRLRRVAFQPLDYLPPVDVQFSDYARAVIRADEIAEPLDESGYRGAMKQVFKKRGIDCDEENPGERDAFYPNDFDRLSRSRTDAYHFLNENRRQFFIPVEQDIAVVDLYQTDKPVSGHSNQHREVVVQYTWRESVELKGKEFGTLAGEFRPLLCGGTLAFDSRGHLLSWQRKPGTGKIEGGRRLRGYCQDEQEKGIQRRDQLLNFIRDQISTGAVGLDEIGRPDQVGLRSPYAVNHAEDESLRLGVTPHLRHWAEK